MFFLQIGQGKSQLYFFHRVAAIIRLQNGASSIFKIVFAWAPNFAAQLTSLLSISDNFSGYAEGPDSLTVISELKIVLA